jgi:hypothetical protein
MRAGFGLLNGQRAKLSTGAGRAGLIAAFLPTVPFSTRPGQKNHKIRKLILWSEKYPTKVTKLPLLFSASLSRA